MGTDTFDERDFEKPSEIKVKVFKVVSSSRYDITVDNVHSAMITSFQSSAFDVEEIKE